VGSFISESVLLCKFDTKLDRPEVVGRTIFRKGDEITVEKVKRGHTRVSFRYLSRIQRTIGCLECVCL
jgi:hypothetical protein